MVIIGTKKTEILSMKVEPVFKDRVIKRASEENRNLSNFIVTVLTKYLDDIDRAKELIGK